MDFKTIVVELGSDSGRETRLQAAAVLATASAGHVVGVTATGFSPEPYRGAGMRPGAMPHK